MLVTGKRRIIRLRHLSGKYRRTSKRRRRGFAQAVRVKLHYPPPRFWAVREKNLLPF